VENKRIDVLFGIVVIGFLVVTLVLVKDFNARRAGDFKEYVATITNIVKLKNNKIRMLSNMLITKEKQNADLENTLTDTRNALDALSKKLVQPAPVAAPAPAVATTTVPVTATK